MRAGASRVMKCDLSSHGIVALVMKGDEFLLLEDARELMRGCWAPPHGRCDQGDRTEEDAVVREVFEETGLKVVPVRKVWTTRADTKVKTVSFWVVERIEGEVTLDDETSSFGYFTVDQALDLKLYPGTRRFFELVKSKKLSLANLKS